MRFGLKVYTQKRCYFDQAQIYLTNDISLDINLSIKYSHLSFYFYLLLFFNDQASEIYIYIY